MRVFGIVFTLMLGAGPALAAVDLTTSNACFDAAVAGKTNPAQCIEAAQNTCLEGANGGTPAVTVLCFSEARDSWSAGLADTLAQITGQVDEKLAALARIETKYNLLTNLMECDRIEELSVAVSDMDGDAISIQSASCKASAAAATYMHLYLRAKSLPQ